MGDDDGPADLLARLLTRSRSDLVAYGLVALTLLLALGGPAAWCALDERLARSLPGREPPAAERGEVYRIQGGLVFWSGRDRVPQDGLGDDVVLYAPDDWRVRAVEGGGDALLGLAIALAAAWEVGRGLGAIARAPRGGLPVEVGRAALLAAPVVLVAGGALFLLDRAAPGLARSIEQDGPLPLFVPVRPAVLGTLIAVAWAVALGLRLRARADEDGSSAGAAVGSAPA